MSQPNISSDREFLVWAMATNENLVREGILSGPVIKLGFWGQCVMPYASPRIDAF